LVDAPDGDERRRVWDSLSVDRRRSVLDAVVTITILRGKPGGGRKGQTMPVDPATIRLDWHA
jgi:hypothetical protein